MPLAWLLAVVGLGVWIMTKEAEASITDDKNLRPTKWDELFKKYANQYGVDWKILKTISMNESSLGTNSRVVAGLNNPYDIKGSASTDGLSWGLMQFTVKTAKQFDSTADEIKLNNPEYSIKLGAQFVSYLKKKFPNTRDAVMAYNHGEGNQSKFITAEKNGTLKTTEYSAGRAYWNKYQSNYKLLWG